jgi:site-specific DNA-cytosine methylase
MKILSICTGMGLMDRAFMDMGFDVVPGCEIDPDMRRMHESLCGGKHLTHDLSDLPGIVSGQHFTGIIGGPPCQAHSILRAMRKPKFPDLTPLVELLLECVTFDWYVFENVRPIPIPSARHTMLNAMNYYVPHQSRERWFTHFGIMAPAPLYPGDVDSLRAYSVVAGRIYGPKRGAWLQGYEDAAKLPVPCVTLQKGLANAVPYPLARAWAHEALALQETALS